jgi:CRISPR-associated DxTHG motif protein
MGEKRWGLITVLGRNPREAQYCLGNGTVVRSKLAAVAVAQELGLGAGDYLFALTTPDEDVQAAFWELATAVHAQLPGVEMERVPIPHGTDNDEVFGIVAAVVHVLTEHRGRRFVLDVTHGLRHLAMLTLATALFVAALDEPVAVERAFYAPLELFAPQGRPTPLLELSGLLDVLQLAGSVRQWQRFGATEDIVRALGRYQRRQGAELRPLLGKLKASLDAFSRNMRYAASLQIGREGAAVRDLFQQLERESSRLREEGVVLHMVVERLSNAIEARGVLDQGQSLTREELQREWNLARWYWDNGELHQAALLLREWVVNAFLFQSGEERWLIRETRECAERALGRCDRKHREKFASVEENRWAESWRLARVARNDAAHGWFGEKLDEQMRQLRGNVSKMLWLCDRWLQGDFPAVPTLGDRKVLVGALGMDRPGALYTALVGERPDVTIVVTTAQAGTHLTPLLSAAAYGVTSRKMVENPSDFLWSHWHGLVLT